MGTHNHPLHLYFVFQSGSKTITKEKGKALLIYMDQLFWFLQAQLEMEAFCYFNGLSGRTKFKNSDWF